MSNEKFDEIMIVLLVLFEVISCVGLLLCGCFLGFDKNPAFFLLILPGIYLFIIALDRTKCPWRLGLLPKEPNEPPVNPPTPFSKYFWKDANGNHPKLFTTITLEDVKSGKYTPANSEYQEKIIVYLKKLRDINTYSQCVIYP